MKKRIIFSGPSAQRFTTYGIVIAAWIVLEVMLHAGLMSSHLEGLLVPMAYYAIVAVGLNLCVGILGELSLGHAGFMCVGAFSSALFSLVTVGKMPDGLRFFIALIIGVISAAIVGFLIGIPVLRLNGDYLAIVTLAFGEIIKNIINALYLGVDTKGVHVSFESLAALNMEPDGQILINGAMGVTGTPHDANFTIAIVLLLLALIVVQNFIDSRDGRAVMSIRDNRIAAESIGIPVTSYKMLAFTISAAVAGMAGVIFSHNIATLQSTSQYFGYNVSIMILVYVVLGGIGSIRGSVIAAAVLYLLPELLRGLNKYRMLIYSVVLIAVMIVNWAPKAIEKRTELLNSIRKGMKKNGTA